MARDKTLNADCAHVLYAALVMDKRHDMAAVARRMGIPYSTLSDYAANRANFPPYLVAPLYAATQDAELVSKMLGLGDVGLVLVEAKPAEQQSGVYRLALAHNESGGKVSAALRAVTAKDSEGGETITENEGQAVAPVLDEHARITEALRRRVVKS
jgi:hypothetical protein